MPKLVQIFTDGGSRGNPGNSAIGVWVVVDQQPTYSHSGYIGIATNNIAEYKAFLHSLNWVEKQFVQPVELEWSLDSLLVVNQINGLWKIKDLELKKIATLCATKLKLLKEHGFVYQIKHIPREENHAADALVNQALDQLPHSV